MKLRRNERNTLPAIHHIVHLSGATHVKSFANCWHSGGFQKGKIKPGKWTGELLALLRFLMQKYKMSLYSYLVATNPFKWVTKMKRVFGRSSAF